MENIVSSHSSVLVKGLAVTVGEIVFGVNGPFLFERFGLYTPVAIGSGVVLGAVFGYVVAAFGLALRHRKPAVVAHHIPADAQLHTH